jgi:hypothetical protein
MLGTLFDWVRDFKEKIGCKKCNYKSLFAIGMLRHWSKCYNIKPNKRDLRFLLKYNFISRLIKLLVACVLIPPLFVLKLVCYLLGEFSEIL